MRIAYRKKSIGVDKLELITTADRVIKEYTDGGYRLTLRQLYYQFVARGIFPEDRRFLYDGLTRKWVRSERGTRNAPPNYKWLGAAIKDGREMGLISWLAIEDRTRSLKRLAHWNDPHGAMNSLVAQYSIDKWKNQLYRPEVWVEKDALLGVVGGVCDPLDVPYFSCRGFVSATAMWSAGHERFKKYKAVGQIPIVFHLGDHDPSGIDMTRDIEDRLGMFAGDKVVVDRIALSIEQVRHFSPPPNPTKMTDSRAGGYVDKFGDYSWELDALTPDTMHDLIRKAVMGVRDEDEWQLALAEEEEDVQRLRELADSYL